MTSESNNHDHIGNEGDKRDFWQNSATTRSRRSTKRDNGDAWASPSELFQLQQSLRNLPQSPSSSYRMGRPNNLTRKSMTASFTTDNNQDNHNHSSIKNTMTRSMSSRRSLEQQQDDEEYCRVTTASLAARETVVIRYLRLTVLVALAVASIAVALSLWQFTRTHEQAAFERNFYDASRQIVQAFASMVEGQLGASASMATSLTSFAQHQVLQHGPTAGFPFVTLPDFSLRAAHSRVQSGSHVVQYMPVVTDDQREAWEAYALEHRSQIDEAFLDDQEYRQRQDTALASLAEGSMSDSHEMLSENHGTSPNDNSSRRRKLQDSAEQQQKQSRNMTILDDGTGFHAKIWSRGELTPAGDEDNGQGPFLPAWQRSPVNDRRQEVLNLNWANRHYLAPIVDEVLLHKRAAVGSTNVPPTGQKQIQNQEANLRLSQYRQNIDEYLDGVSSFLAYPVRETFDPDAAVAGVLVTNIYWKVLLSNVLPSQTKGLICVVENGFNQTFSYQIDGNRATFLGMHDAHDHAFDHMQVSESVHSYLTRRASPIHTAYETAPMSDISHYRLRVYPSSTTADQFLTQLPMTYTLGVAAGFLIAAALFLCFSHVTEQRQSTMYDNVVENSRKAAAAERELNEFMSHEVRNPLSAAMSACSFVVGEVQTATPDLATVRRDMHVVDSSLHFINDFLRTMLDIHRADGNRIKIQKTVVDLKQDVLDPIEAILFKRVAAYRVELECPADLLVLTDCIRLKQVVLNLVRNSSKFVEHGFVRMRAVVSEPNQVLVMIEDSGPGIPVEKRDNLFSKYQESLDLLSQGTGLGLSLSKKLMKIMNGDVWLDDTYDSGVPNCPGARFVLQLNTPPVKASDENISDFLTKKDAPSTTTTTMQLEEESSAMSSSAVSSHVVEATEDPPPAQPDPHELPTQLRVLFVDDDSVLRKLFVRAVKKAQPEWTVAQASSGEAAMKLCETETFDLIFLDQYMASVEVQMLGSETAQAMRAAGIQSILCGLSANNVRDIFRNAGADHFILKPIPCKADDLRNVLREILFPPNEIV